MFIPNLNILRGIILLLTLACCFSSCSFGDKEDPIVREQRLVQELLQNNKAQFYKASKIILRSPIYMADSVNHASQILPAPYLTYFLFNLPLFINDPVSSASLKTYVSASREVYNLKDKLNTLHEDDYPTLLENFFFVYDSTRAMLPLLKIYNSSTEHVLLVGLWMGSRKAPPEFSLYEASLFNPEQTPLLEAQFAGHLGRALLYYDNAYFYLSEKSSTEYISTVEKEQDNISPDLVVFPGTFSAGKKSAYYQLHGVGFAMRGLSRKKIEKEEESLQDFEQFLSDMNNAGVDNEMVWIVGSIVALQREDATKSVVYLTKLEQSPIFSIEEKEQIKLLKEYVINQQQEKALIEIDSKLFIAKILFYYAKKNLTQSKIYTDLQKNKASQKIIQLPMRLDSAYQMFSATTKVDSIASSLENGVKDLFK